MPPPATKLAATLLAACVWMCAPICTAHAQIAFTPCGDSNDFACGHLTVPLDPTGATPGAITLAMRRHRAPIGEARSAIITLAGGPGQPALPFAEQFAEVLGPLAATRDMIVFDQRGVGLSHPLSCHAFERPDLFHSLGALVQTCAEQLGSTRAFYTTADSVADIEAIRQAGGYEKLVLYGTSYGTKVAEQYAQAYPQHVEALVLDSVVTPSGPEPLGRATFAAVPRILQQVCAYGSCAHVTRNPVADLARVVREMRRAPLRGRVIDRNGNAHMLRMSSDELAQLLLAGDLLPLLRAEFVTALSAAAHGDTAPLARLLATAGQVGEGEGEDFDMPLYYATSCEEQAFPWSRAATPRARIAQATAAARALPAGALGPFDAADALDLSDVQACAHWPFATPAPVLDDAPLPNVPTLILSGADDLRTPIANAREVAAQIPDSHLLVVPYTGHSVLTDEPTACAREALLAMFAPGPLKPCRATPPPASLRPPPLPPLRLALLSPAAGYRGLPGRTLHALSLTLGDFVRQLALQLAASASGEEPLSVPTLRFGGLRGGWAEYAGGTLIFHDYAYTPGVTLSGAIRQEAADLQIGGFAAAHGTLRRGPHGSLTGTLGGSDVHLDLTSAATVAIVGSDAAASAPSSSGGSAAHIAAGELARFLRRVLRP